ncbi:MAG: T9SS type A sorting domain-containing protein [Bacteroidales bacterium]
MKKNILYIVMLLFASGFTHSFSQPWMRTPFLKKDKSTANFYDIQKAFYSYWGDRKFVKGKGYMQFKRWENLMKSKVFPVGTLPDPLKSWKEYNTFMSAYSSSKDKNLLTSANWVPLGITNWTNGNSGYNPGNGRLNTVTVDPANPNVIFVASPSGGVWKSNDGGSTWNTTYDNQPLLGASAIAIDPSNSNIIYIGTGDRDSWDNKSIGILKSTDGGATWTTTGLSYTASYNSINKILINPLKPTVINVATSDGIYKSTDAGNTFTQVYSGGKVTNILYRSGDTTVVYGSGDFFLRSVDGGLNFFNNSAGLPSNAPRVEMAVTPANANCIYIVASAPDETFGGLYKSTNAGSTFNTQSTTPNIMGYSADGSDDAGMAWYDLAIAVSPTDANEVIVGGINVWKSMNGGVDWTPSSIWYWGSGYGYTHADIHFLGFYGNRLYCGSDGGVFYSDDYGMTWNDISGGLGITQFYRLAGADNYPDLLLGGAQDNGSNIYLNGSWTHVFGGDGQEGVVDFTNSNTLYVSCQNGYIIKSTDGGSNFADVSADSTGTWTTPYLIHPSDHNLLFAGYADIYKSTDGASTWNKISDNLTNGNSVEQLAVTPSNPDYIYASESNNLYKTNDGGATWSSSAISSLLYITGITVDETNPQKIWVSATSYYSDKVYYSKNGGLTFTDVTGNLTNLGFNCIIHQKGTHNGLYLGTDNGVFYTDSILGNWIPFNTGMPNVIIKDFEINYPSGKIRAATYGRGIWESNMYSNPQGIAEENSDDVFELFPNPTNGKIEIKINSFMLKTPKIYVYNIVGKLIKTYDIDANSKTATIDLSGFVVGSYFIKLQDRDISIIKRVSLIN